MFLALQPRLRVLSGRLVGGVRVGVGVWVCLWLCVAVWLWPARVLTLRGYVGVCCPWLVAWCAVPLVVARGATCLACSVLVTQRRLSHAQRSPQRKSGNGASTHGPMRQGASVVTAAWQLVTAGRGDMLQALKCHARSRRRPECAGQVIECCLHWLWLRLSYTSTSSQEIHACTSKRANGNVQCIKRMNSCACAHPPAPFVA